MPLWPTWAALAPDGRAGYVARGRVRLLAGDAAGAITDYDGAAKVDRTIECAVRFSDLGCTPDGTCEFVVVLKTDAGELERWPRDGLLSLDVPSDTYELDHWQA